MDSPEVTARGPHPNLARAPSGDDYQDFHEPTGALLENNGMCPIRFLMATTRPFGAHNRISPAESIGTIMDEKGASSLH